ncbi:MAG TPA: hypothetical protein VKP65_24705, partial [Rhodothermales bacterium]|nr:hypothetical protein [Rhodothermales bacterium]
EQPTAKDLGANTPAKTPSELGTLTPMQLSQLLLDGMVPVSGPETNATTTEATASSVQGALQPVAALPASLAPYAESEARWLKTYFENDMGDGATQLFEAYMRPVEASGFDEGGLFQTYFRAATPDGEGFGTWFQGYFQSHGDTFRLLDDTQVDLPDEGIDPALFDYLTETEVDQAFKANAPRRATVLATNDGVIRQSLCVGNDCPNSPSFGFDTQRLQENNTRFHFDDTSSSGSFPFNDWRLTANGSQNGDPSYFSIDDATAGRQLLEMRAGTQAHAIYTTGSAVGFGTDVPVVELHTVDGDTPTLRLQQDGSSGFAQQTWDVAGNEAGFFVRDVTNGGGLPFRILPGVANNFFTIAGNERVSIGAGVSPAGRLHIEGTDGGDEDDFIVTDGGLVGVGTITPNARMQILAPTGVHLNLQGPTPQFRFTQTSPGTQLFSFIIDGGGDFVIRDITAGNIDRIEIEDGTGTVNIPGTLSKGGGSFKIDHPIDPENKLLYHSFVESPDMMNVYNGNVTLNANGEALVELPEYFEALNREFRYQLTPIGAPGPGLYIAEEISGNQFRVAGGTPGAKVSWQVTGVRKDAWAEQNRIPVEVEKRREYRGFYLHPKAFGQPESRGISSIKNRELELQD